MIYTANNTYYNVHCTNLHRFLDCKWLRNNKEKERKKYKKEFLTLFSSSSQGFNIQAFFCTLHTCEKHYYYTKKRVTKEIKYIQKLLAIVFCCVICLVGCCIFS